MINTKLTNWISKSESWETSKDFQVNENKIKNEDFLKRFEDFYINLISLFYDILNAEDLNDKEDELLSICKGLEIFSLEKTKESFSGVIYSENMIYVSGLYYLSGYTSSSFVLAKFYSVDLYQSDVDKFLSSFFRRELNTKTEYNRIFNQFLDGGDYIFLDELLDLVSNKIENCDEPYDFLSLKLTKKIISKFKINNIYRSLVNNDLDYWIQYIKFKIKGKNPVWDFFPSQKKAIQMGLVSSSKSMSLQMPTSSGKTSICEIAIFNETKKNPENKVLFLVPYRALASELKNTLCRNLLNLGIKSKVIYGGNLSVQEYNDSIENVNLVISTPEKLMAIQNATNDIYDYFSVIICDEGHLLDQDDRGLNYELLISKIKCFSNYPKRFLFLSAIIPNISSINNWLGGNDETKVISNYRPVKINYAFLEESNKKLKNYSLNVNPTKKNPEKYKIENFIVKEDFNSTKKLSKIEISVITTLKSLNTGSVILFSPTKDTNTGVIKLSESLIENIENNNSLPKPIKYAKKVRIEILEEYFEQTLGKDNILYKLIKAGVALHHGDIPQDIRELIEDYLRNNYIRLVICTNTLAEGVNLPIKTIVIHTVKRFNPSLEKQENMKIRDLKNLFGRAGRASKERKGMVIVTNNNDFSHVKKVILDQDSEDVKGSLYNVIKKLSTQLIKNNIPISEKILENQKEELNELLDSIDYSIISLLSEDIEIELLDTLLSKLIEETFAYQQSSDIERNLLKKIVTLRGQKIKKFIESNEFKTIKKSNSNIRLYENIVRQINLEDDLWITTDDIISPTWMIKFKDIITNIPHINDKIIEFCNKNNISIKTPFFVMFFWLKGENYKNIAAKSSDKVIQNISVDLVFKILSSLINFYFQNIANITIKVVQEKLYEKNIQISNKLLDFPNYLLYGLKKRLELDLIQIGFTERLGIICLSKFLEENIKDVDKDNIEYLKTYIKREYLKIELYLKKEKIPIISLDKIKETIKTL